MKFILFFEEVSTNLCEFWKSDRMYGNLKLLMNLERNNQLLGRHLAHRLQPHGPAACAASV
jgi:hypothetical protein